MVGRTGREQSKMMAIAKKCCAPRNVADSIGNEKIWREQRPDL
jgi:hypothetical protein